VEKSIQKQTCPEQPVVSKVEPGRGISRLACGSLEMTIMKFSPEQNHNSKEQSHLFCVIQWHKIKNKGK